LPESSSALGSVRVAGGVCTVGPAGGACTVGPAGACASTTEGDTIATLANRSNTTANTVRLQDEPVMGFPSIVMGPPGTSASFRTDIEDSSRGMIHRGGTTS
jgi:hypothetical protein